MSFSDRLSALVRERGISYRELGRRIGVAHVSISKWIQGGASPTDENLESLAEYFGVTPAFLRYGEEGATSYNQTCEIDDDVISIPVLDVDGSCGITEIPSPGVALVKMLRVTKKWLLEHAVSIMSFGALHIITARSDSMEPGIKRGDFVLVDCSQRGQADDGIFAVQYAGNVFIKRVQVQPDGKLLLLSDNPSYPPQRVDDVASVTLVGKCVLSFNVRML